MNPIVSVEVGTLQLVTTSYRFFFVLAAVATVSLGVLVATRRDLPVRGTLACLAATAVAVPVGARLLDVLTKPGPEGIEIHRLFALEFAGFSMFGGLLLASGVAVLACRALGIGVRKLADSLAPALGLGIAVMKAGCFEAGCCYGRESDLPWAVTFPPGSDAAIGRLLTGAASFALAAPAPVHPTQLYEAAAGLAALALSLVILRGRAADGVAFASAVAFFSTFRFANHWLREPGPGLALPEWLYPALYLGIALGAVLWIVAVNSTVKTGERRQSFTWA